MSMLLVLLGRVELADDLLGKKIMRTLCTTVNTVKRHSLFPLKAVHIDLEENENAKIVRTWISYGQCWRGLGYL